MAITGQTIGPAFDARTRELVAEVLAGSVFVGVREEHSYRLALELGAQSERTALQFDEAIALEGVEPERSAEIVGDGPFIAVTLNQLGDISDPNGVVPKFAAQLAELGRCTSAAVVLVPHVGDLGGAAVHDVAMARAVIAAAGDSRALRMAPLPSPEEAVWYCRHAQLVVSSRYHPTVFAIATGTPALFLYQDHYTLVKGQGTLALAGLQGWIVSAGLAGLGSLVPAAMELWNRRDAVREHLQSLDPAIERSRRRHVEALLAALVPARRPPASVEPIVRRSGPSPEGEWVEHAHDGLAVLDAHIAETHWQVERAAMQRQLVLSDLRVGTAETWAGLLAKEVERKEADLVIAHSALQEIAKKEHGARTGDGSHATQPVRQNRAAIDACTIVARNYLPYARVFAQSLTAAHPQARVTVLVIDGDADPSDDGLFRSLRLEDVIPDAAERRRQTFMYDVTELSTAVKPLLLQRLLAEGAPSVLYFDPDIQVFDSVESLSHLAAERGIVLTPHMLSPIPDDGFEVSDLAVLRAGVFNLGFIGVGAGTDRFLDWWSGRLRRHCISDPANGMFVDQRWLDYVAGLFPHAIVDDPGCNVAYWNLHERECRAHGERLRGQRRPPALLPFQRIRSRHSVPPEPVPGKQPACSAQRAAGAAELVRRLRGEAPHRRALSGGRELRLLGASGRHANRSGHAASVSPRASGCRASGSAGASLAIPLGRHPAVAELAGARGSSTLALPVRAPSIPRRSATDLSTAVRRGSRGLRALGPVRPLGHADHPGLAPAERIVRIDRHRRADGIPIGDNGSRPLPDSTSPGTSRPNWASERSRGWSHPRRGPEGFRWTRSSTTRR